MSRKALAAGSSDFGVGYGHVDQNCTTTDTKITKTSALSIVNFPLSILSSRFHVFCSIALGAGRDLVV